MTSLARTLMIAGILGLAADDLAADMVLYETGFERPDFSPNQPLVGQGGFVAYDGVNEDVPIVVENSPGNGTQAVQIRGADLGPYNSDFYAVFLYVPLNVDLDALGLPILRASVDVQLDLAQDDPTNLYVGIQLYDINGAYVTGVGINRGAAIGDNFDGDVVTEAVDPTEIHTVAFEANFSTRLLRFFLNGASFGELAMTGSGIPVLGDVDITYSSPEALRGNAYVDNYRISAHAVPEPSSLVLLAVAMILAPGALLATARARCTKSA